MSRVYILLVNWNGWADTVECLESLFRLDYPDFRVIVCDNGSSDGSLEQIKSWAEGKLPEHPGGSSELCHLISPPVIKPLSWIELARVSAEAGGDLEKLPPLILVRNEENLGFAGGNNVGLRFVLSRGDGDFVWLLNNDTVVPPGALKAMVERLGNRPSGGICGSSILNYRRPLRIDALGGAYYCRWLGLAWHLGRFRPFVGRFAVGTIERHMDYVVGASMLVSKRFLHDIGLLDESYFLYYEELDWATRSKGRFELVYAPDSVVYHKIGGTIGTSSSPGGKSLLSDYYTLRNRLRFTRKYYPIALPTVYLGVFCALIVRLLLGQWHKAHMVWRLLLDPDRSFDRCTANP